MITQEYYHLYNSETDGWRLPSFPSSRSNQTLATTSPSTTTPTATTPATTPTPTGAAIAPATTGTSIQDIVNAAFDDVNANPNENILSSGDSSGGSSSVVYLLIIAAVGVGIYFYWRNKTNG